MTHHKGGDGKFSVVVGLMIEIYFQSPIVVVATIQVWPNIFLHPFWQMQQTPTWHLTQNVYVKSILTTLVNYELTKIIEHELKINEKLNKSALQNNKKWIRS